MITYKRREKGIHVYRKKYFHNFRTPINHNSHENTHGIDLELPGVLILADGHLVKIYNNETYKLIDTIKLRLFKVKQG
jgi:hypothetical protein